jgi:hypothetical protein
MNPPQVVPAHARQLALLHVEPGGVAHVRRADQLPVEVVEPVVIRAGELLGVADPLRRDLGAAVQAEVGERVDFPGLVARDDDRFVEDVQRHVIAGVRDLVETADHQPVLHEQAFLFEFQHLGVAVQAVGNVARIGERLADRLRALLYALDDFNGFSAESRVPPGLWNRVGCEGLDKYAEHRLRRQASNAAPSASGTRGGFIS